MKKLFENFKLSAFGILFIILILVAGATWFVPAGKYEYVCPNGNSAFVYTNVDGEEVGICPLTDQANDQLIVANATSDGDVEAIEAVIQTYSQEIDLEAASYEYVEQEPQKQGIWDVIQAPVDGFIKAIEIIVFVLAIGGFINIVIKSGAMDAGIYALLNKFKGKELLLIPILMTLFAIGGTTYGMAEETIAFYVILIPVLFRAGFDNAVGMMIIALGAGVGTLASTINPFAIGVASTATGVSSGSGVVGRFIFWIIVLIIAIVYVMHYAKKVKNDPKKSITYDQHEQLAKEFGQSEQTTTGQKMNTGQKILLVLFALTFLLMVLSVIPWASAFNLTIFEDFTALLNNAIPVFGGSDGVLPFGDWYFVEMTALFLAGSFVMGVVARYFGLIKENIVDVFIEGAKDMMSVALIIGLARGIQIILESSGMAPTLLYYASNLLAGLPTALFTVLTYIFYIPLSFLVPSTSGLATATMPIVGDLANSVFGAIEGKIQVITAFSMASGLVNLVAPTSGVIMAALSLSKMEYGKWIKLVTPLLIILFVVSCAFLFITTQLGFYI